MQTAPQVISLLNYLDYIVFFVITGATFLCVCYGNSKKVDKESDSFLEHLLMGRRLTLPMFIATLVATWYGGIFGVAQMAFDYGIFNFITQGVFWYLSYLVFAFFVLGKINQTEAVTLPGLIQNLVGKKSATLAAYMNILNLMPIVYSISIGLLIQILFGLSLPFSIIIGVSFAVSYSFFGGFKAVVYSDIFQFFIMLLSVIMVFLFSIKVFGFEKLMVLESSYFSPLAKFSLFETFAWGLIAFSTLVDPNFYHRCFAADSKETAKKGIIFSTIIWIIFDLSLTFGAMYAKAVIPEADSEQGYFLYALQLLPHGLKGFFIAGICATVLSTLDSYIFLAASTISVDLLPKRFRHSVSAHHISIISVACLSILMAFIFEGNIKSVWKTLGSLSSSALLVPTMFALFYKKKIEDNAFVFSAILGGIAVIYWRLSGMKSHYQIDEIYVGVLLSLTSLIITSMKKTSS